MVGVEAGAEKTPSEEKLSAVHTKHSPGIFRQNISLLLRVYKNRLSMTFADQVIAFNQQLQFDGPLPDDIRIMNPFRENPGVLDISSAFYRKFYNDQQPRKLILGINPGRFGAGATGIPFTDSKRLEEHCGLSIDNRLHELSSVFVYEVVDACGGAKAFYEQIYINSVCPLGFVKPGKKGHEINYNYYDSAALTKAVLPFILASLQQQLAFGIDTTKVFCLGTGKNYQFLQQLNAKHHLFEQLVPLEHPRYVMQYKLKQKDDYIQKYVEALFG